MRLSKVCDIDSVCTSLSLHTTLCSADVTSEAAVKASPARSPSPSVGDLSHQPANERIEEVKEKKPQEKKSKSKDKSPKRKEAENTNDEAAATKQKNPSGANLSCGEDDDGVMHVVIGGQKIKIKTKATSPAHSPEKQRKTSKDDEQPAKKTSVSPSVKQKKDSREKLDQVEKEEVAATAEPVQDLLTAAADSQQSEGSEEEASSPEEAPPSTRPEPAATTNFDLLGDLEVPQTTKIENGSPATQNADILDLFGDTMGNRSVCSFVVECLTMGSFFCCFSLPSHLRFECLYPCDQIRQRTSATSQ